MIVGWRRYADGVEIASGTDLGGAIEDREAGTHTWIRVVDPDEAELRTLAGTFGLPDLVVEDTVQAGQRPKLERYGDALFVVARPAVYVDATETVELGELHVFTAPDATITVRHGCIGALEEAADRLAASPPRAALGPLAVLHAVLDHVVDAYDPVVVGLERDIEEIELAVFDDEGRGPTRRIYALVREVIDFHRAAANLVRPLDALAMGRVDGVPPDLEPHFRDVADHARVVVERLEGFRQLLDGALQANVSLVGLRENRDQRKISAWAAMALVPTIIGGIWGMNVGLPLQDTAYGFPALVVVMGVTLGYLYWRFKRHDWL